MNIADIDQHKLQSMTAEAEAVHTQYNSLSERSFKIRSLIEDARNNVEVEKTNQQFSKDSLPDVPPHLRNQGVTAKAINAPDYSKRIEVAQDKLDQLLKERANLQHRMGEVGEKSANLATMLRRINKALIASNINIYCLERFA